MDGLSKLVTHFVWLLTLCVAGATHASYPVYADGDFASLPPPDAHDGLITNTDLDERSTENMKPYEDWFK